MTPSVSTEANKCARAVVALVEESTGKAIEMPDCVKIVHCIGEAMQSLVDQARGAPAGGKE